ncbi:uncharacterized protein DUF4214 [Pseudoduganella lurida]|uniref:Uncharacterized protein DUF4214 n=1 Tax=Pseudoduganella lurida TaxID=1036180 RepID=A0A562R7I3_9BURK|nr:DUF4214 domain-containing protein [Pseudoduganella lurida]TWI64336.1 uncharacterized protein DUF4214 [Pseudoduganella lurida]
MTTATEIQQLYVAYFNRPADVLGLSFWLDRANKSSISAVANEFANSTEYTDVYGGKTAAEQVNAIYMNLFGRPAEAAGLVYWANKLIAGTETFGSIALTIAGAAQNADKIAIDSKVAAASAFTASLTDGAEIVGYSGDAANSVARAFLAGVTDAATLATATTEANLNAVAAAAVAAHDGTATTTTNLTAGVDTLTGTAGADIFNALSVTASGAAGSTLGNFDSIDGGAGNDTLNIYTDAGATTPINTTIGSNTTIRSIETINIFNSNGAVAALADGSKFTGATALWQIGAAANVTNLESSTTAGFRGLTTAAARSVTATDAATSASIAVDGVVEGSTFNVISGTSGKLAAVNLSGVVTDSTGGDGVIGNTNLGVTVGKDVQTLTLNTSVATNLSITDNAGSATTKKLTTINAAASTGAITYADSETTVANITTGSGKDDITLVTVTAKDNATTTTVDETVTATVNTGAGDDTIRINVTGNGIVTVNAGEGNDTVNIIGRDAATLNINLGAGDDIFTSAVAINGTDSIDAGEGYDTLLLNLVGSANVGAFSNFDAFDAKNLAKALDVEILSQKNTVSEIITTGDVGTGAVLQNVGAGVGYRITGDTGTVVGGVETALSALTINQKVAGDLTVTLDIDETATTAATTTATSANASVITNATGVKAVFDSSFVGEAVNATGDNVAALTVAGTALKTIAITSGGDNALNTLNVANGAGELTAITSSGDQDVVINVGTGAAKLASITATGEEHVTVTVGTGAIKLATIDTSGATGGLTASLASVIDGGTIKLGSGADLISVTSASSIAGVESIQGFEKALAVAVSTATGDASAKADAIADADMISLGAAGDTYTVAANATNLTNGVLTFTGAGPSTLADAAGLADTATTATAGAALVFEYTGSTYLFVQGGATDTLVQLTGVTGVTNLVENGTTNHFFIV